MFQVKKKGGFISFLCFTPFWKLIYLSFNGDFSIDWNLQKKEQKLKNITLICMLHSFIHSFIYHLLFLHYMSILLDISWCFIFKNMCVYHGVYAWRREEGKPWVGVGLVCLCFLFFKSFNLWLLNFIFYVCILEIWFLFFFLLILLVLTPIVSSCCFSFNASW